MKKIMIIVLVIVVLFLLGGSYTAYYVLVGPNYSTSIGGKVLTNPIADLSDDEAVAKFNEDFVLYLLYSIGVNQLHNPPLSDNTPKLEIIVADKIFSAEVLKGKIDVRKGEIENEDIVIKTTKEEVVKMLRDKNYVVQSFRDGKSKIELVAGEVGLAAKGYLKIYNKLNGN